MRISDWSSDVCSSDLALTFAQSQTPDGNTRPKHIFMAGNSTMANKPYRGSNPEKGWGQVLGLYFNEQVKVENHAVNGQSSTSFIDEGKWDNLLQQVDRKSKRLNSSH